MDTTPCETDDDNLILIELPSEFAREWVEKNYYNLILETLLLLTDEPIVLKLVAKGINRNSSEAKKEPVYETVEKDDLSTAYVNSISQEVPSFRLNPKYTFDSFVVGSNNRFANAAAVAVSQAPGKSYNPLFLYGGVGLGKTHLMQAIGHKVKENNSNIKVVYVSCEQFTNELIEAIAYKKTPEFRNKYRRVDVLLIDDIQFLANKDATQEEFFHTFNALFEAGKQIVISSDRPPKEMATLEDRLRSRFECGLITDMQAPDLETRVAILKKKVALDNIPITQDVLIYLAGQIHSNIRELEGALLRLTAFSRVTEENLTVDVAAIILKDMLTTIKPKQITVKLIKEVVAEYFHIDIAALSAKSKVRNVTLPRQVAMYLARELTESSLPKVGEEFGGRNHSTVIHAHDKITSIMDEDADLAERISEIIVRLKSC